MRLSFFFTLFIGFGFATLAFGQQRVSSAEVRTLEGQTVQLDTYFQNADYTVLSFWATWCKPCQTEMDAIMDLYPTWTEELGVQMLAITIDDQRMLAKVPGIISTKGWEYTILSDPNNVMRNQLGFQSIPQTYVVDREGNVVYSHTGYKPGDEYELEEKLKELTGK